MALPLNDLQRMLPPLPAVRAHWAPVYFEPLPGSGERIVVAVAAVTGSGGIVVRALDRSRTKCMYRQQSDQIDGFIDMIEDSLRDHLDLARSFEGWAPPIDGTVHLGATRESWGDSLEDIARAGVTLTSSVGSVRSAPEIVDDAPTQEPSRWELEIKRNTVFRRADWADRFSKLVLITPRAAPTRIGYIGVRVAANFERLAPNRLSELRDRAKARLVNLQILRDVGDRMFPRDGYELLIWKPEERPADWTHTGFDHVQAAQSELVEFGDRHHIRVRAVASTEAATQRLLEAEAVPA